MSLYIGTLAFHSIASLSRCPVKTLVTTNMQQ
uniref:Uncharacterized protein n=1 Tax=Anguilla anguilla TaxID=7936 RepID=A0A0E9WG03_ANGAN